MIEDYPFCISDENTAIILEQMKFCLCKIYMNQVKGTGFFCKIPFPDEQHLLPVLITNNHIINDSNLKSINIISLAMNHDSIIKKIEIKGRRVYTSELYDTTIIEIFESKDGINKFLELDFKIKNEELNNMYLKKPIYLLHYPSFKRSSVSIGIIKNIDCNINYKLNHLCSIEEGSSGAPILNIINNKLIGINNSFKNQNVNQGILLRYPIIDFISKTNNFEINKKFTLINNTKFIFETSNACRWFIRKKTYLFNEYLNFEGFQLYRFKDNKLIGAIEGPPKTFYENGFFLFEMIFPSDYLFKPPIFKFITKIFHPNISELDGLVSVDILQDQWTPAQCVPEKIILSIQSLLDDPNPDNYLNENAAKLFKEDIVKYENVVRLYTAQFASYDNLQKILSNFDFKVDYI